MEWMTRGACRDKLSLFAGSDGERGEDKTRREDAARTLCQTCPVLTECTDWVLAALPWDPCPGAVLAAMTSEQRRTLHRQFTR